MAFQLRDSEQVVLSVEALDSEGNPANVNIGWSTSDDTIIAIQPNSNGTVTAIASPGAGGLGMARVTADATDVSDGDVHTGTFDIEVIAGDAVSVNIVPGTPETKPV